MHALQEHLCPHNCETVSMEKIYDKFTCKKSINNAIRFLYWFLWILFLKFSSLIDRWHARHWLISSRRKNMQIIPFNAFLDPRIYQPDVQKLSTFISPFSLKRQINFPTGYSLRDIEKTFTMVDK